MTLKNLAKLANEATADRSWIHGWLGRLAADGTTVIYAVPYRDNYVWVRMGSNGDQGIHAALNKGGVALRAGLPVRMRRDNGVLTIYEEDTALFSIDPNAPAAPGGVKIHHHRSVAGTPSAANPLSFELEAKQIDRGRVKSAGGMIVNIAAFRYYHAGAWATWAGGNINLTAYKPATAGHHAWVLVGVDPATNTAIAVTGTSVVYATALVYTDLDAIAFGAYIPCGAVDVRDDDTSLTDIADYVDAHGWFNRDDTATAIHAATLDAAPLDADEVPGLDSSASFALIRWTWTAVKAFLKTYFDTLYLVVAGVAGGQTAHGGTGAGESLTLRGTAHATKGPVVLADDGGNVGVGNGATAPATPFSVIRTDDLGAPYLATYQGLYQDQLMLVEYYHTGTVNSANKIALDLVTKSSTQKRTTARIAASFDTTTDASRNTLLEIGTAIAGTFATAIGMTGKKLGLFGAAAAPQGPLHIHDGTAGGLLVSKTGIVGSAVTIIPNGTGDIVRGVSVRGMAWDGTVATPIDGVAINGSSFIVTPDGFTNSITFAVAADGTFTVVRSAGTRTWSIGVLCVWL